MRQLKRAMHHLKRSAEPGGNGEHNTHLHMLLDDEDAMKTLLEWVQLWANGDVHPEAVKVWLPALVIATQAKGKKKPRPITLEAATMKLIVAVITAVARPELRKAMGDHQHGIGKDGGAPRMINKVAVAMALRPQDPFASLDTQHAYGSASRVGAVQAAEELTPQY